MRGLAGSRAAWWTYVLTVGLLYYVAARIGLALADPTRWVSPFWPPSGLLLAVLVLTPPRRWPPLLGAVIVATLAAHRGTAASPGMAVAFAIANITESALAAFLLIRLRPGPLTLSSLRDVILLVAVGVIGVNGLVAAFVATLASLGAGLPFWRAWLVWWSADGLGMLVIGSGILAWASTNPDDHGPATASRVAELVLALLTLTAVASLGLAPPPGLPLSPTPYLTFPVLLWVAVRFGPRGASLATLLLTVLAIWATLTGRGRFVEISADPARQVLEMQIFLLIEGLSTLALAALTSERRRATAALERARANLEARVAERTAALQEANEHLRHEVTERAATETALRESQARLGQALRLARSFTFEWDRASDAVVRSADCGEILGLEGDAAIHDTGYGFFARIHPDDQAILVEAEQGCTPATPAYRICYRVFKPDGGVVFLEETAQGIFDVDGRPLRVFGITSDVTARERATQRAGHLQAITAGLSAARTPEQVAAVVVEHGLGALEASAGTVFSEIDGHLHLIGAAGYTSEQLRDWERIALNAPIPLAEASRRGEPLWLESREALARDYPAVPTTVVSNQAFAVLPLRADGHSLGVMSISFRQPHPFSEEERGYILTLTGLCAQALERARLFVAEQRAHAEADAAVRLRDQFLSIAAHELRTPLMVLLGTAQLIQRRANRASTLDERDERGLETIAGQARRLDRLITMLLDVSRIERGQLTLDRAALDLGALLARLTEEIQATLAHHRVRLRPHAGALTIVGDELRLEQVFQNLIQNAIKYSPEGGEVVVEAAAEGRWAIVLVRDRGIGIPAAELPSLFTRFFRASNSRERQIGGMGIGLYVAREIVERHGGTLTAFSVEGQGSTFTVRLPLA